VNKVGWALEKFLKFVRNSEILVLQLLCSFSCCCTFYPDFAVKVAWQHYANSIDLLFERSAFLSAVQIKLMQCAL